MEVLCAIKKRKDRLQFFYGNQRMKKTEAIKKIITNIDSGLIQSRDPFSFHNNLPMASVLVAWENVTE